jgi:NMD protein affecting ribosome stability and mRNA decay
LHRDVRGEVDMARERSKTHEPAPRGDRRIEQREGDTYGLKGKLSDPTACPSCGAMYRAGRWRWGSPPVDAQRTLCPACRRVEDGYPAGVVLVEGEFAHAHRDEIQGLARNLEEREKQEHPLKRIMRMEEREDGSLEIATTDVHLAQGIGNALHHAYQGELDYHFTEAENLLRVHWRR